MIIPDRMKIKNNSSKNINPIVQNCGVSVYSSLFNDIVVDNMNVKYTAMNIAYEIMTAITGIFQRPERLSSACFLNVDDEYNISPPDLFDLLIINYFSSSFNNSE